MKPELYVDELNFEIVSSSPYEFTSEELTKFQEEWENGGKETFKIQIGPTYLAYRKFSAI